MSIVRFDQASLHFGQIVLLDNVNLAIERGERVCIVGRNGTGKSTLLKVIAGQVHLDGGSLNLESNLKVAYLQQIPPQQLAITTYQYIAQGLADGWETLEAYHQALEQLATAQDQAAVQRKISALEEQINAKGYWELEAQITRIAKELNIPLDQPLNAFSGGWLRKIELARCLVSNPDVLLLDEPTNHLDLSSITWLEEVVKKYQGSVVFISHDRAFINNLATRIVELDRGLAYSYDLNNVPSNLEPFDYYLAQRDERLRVEAEQWAEFDKKLAQEEVWIRKGIEARRTRNEGRVRALYRLREEKAAQRKLGSFGDLNVSASKSGKLVFEFAGLGLEYGEKKVFADFSLKVPRQVKIAIVGDNGAGKSSLVKTLLGELEPTSGTIKRGTNLAVAYFDQLRHGLDLDKTALENVFDGKVEQSVGGRMRHAIGYLEDYLFSAEKANSKVSSLSGGERNRLLLAKLFAKESNLLVLDEPTNDLDLETLELLEEVVSKYEGTVLIVSHDRVFIDNTADQTWFLEQGKVYPYVGGYSDNLERHLAQVQAEQDKLKAKTKTTAKVEPEVKPATVQPKNRTLKLSYKEQQDLKNLPGQIEQLQAQLADLEQQAQAASATDHQQATALYTQVTQLTAKIGELEEYLLELEIKQEEIENK